MTTVVLHFFIKLIPHYINIFFGYIAGRYLNVQRESIVGLAFYLFVPVVVFSGTSSLKYSPSIAFLPFIIFLVSTGLCLLCYKISQAFWSDNTPNLLGFSAGSANTGYFGLPVAIMLLPPEGVAIYILSFMGIILFEFSVGYYISARGNYTVKQSLKKVAKLPSIYAFALGITLSANGVSIPLPVVEFTDKVKAAYSIMGMMIIGLGLAAIKKFEFDFKYMTVSLISKYIAWPLVIMMIIMLDSNYYLKDMIVRDICMQ